MTTSEQMWRESRWLRRGGNGVVGALIVGISLMMTGVAAGASQSGDAVLALQSASDAGSTGLLDYVSFVPVAAVLLVALAVRRYLCSVEDVPSWLHASWYRNRVSGVFAGFVNRLSRMTSSPENDSRSSEGSGGRGASAGAGSGRQGSGSTSSTAQSAGVGNQQSTSRATARSSSSTPVRTAGNTNVRTTSSTPVRSTGSNTPVHSTSGNTPVQPARSNTPVQPTSSNTPVQPTSSNTPVQTAGSTPVRPSSSTPVNPSSSTPVRPSSSTPVGPSSSTPVRPTNSPNRRGRGSEPVPDRLALVYSDQRIVVEGGDTVDEEIRSLLRAVGEGDHTRWIDDGHLRFVHDEHGFTLVAGGENLTRLNGDRLRAGERDRVYPGDDVELSGVVTLSIRRVRRDS